MVETAAVLPEAPQPPRPAALTVGAVVWLASELMFFSGLFAAYFTLRAAGTGPWPPEGVELEAARAGIFTAVLVVSSATLQLAVRALGRDARPAFRAWVGLTMVLAGAFLLNQAGEWAGAGFTISSHSFGSIFFVMTGFHALHVAGGVGAMGLMLGRSLGSAFGAADVSAVEVVSYYWHFVDVVWIAMYATLFVAT